MSKYPPQNIPEFQAFAAEMERVKKLEGGTEFIANLIEAIVAQSGLVVVDKDENERLRADNRRLVASLIQIGKLPETWSAEGPIPYSKAMQIARATLTSGERHD